MPQRRRPRKGSMGFWPRVRASRIYPVISTWPNSSETKPLGFAGYKAGMTRIMLVDTNPNSKTKGQQVMTAATVLECPPLSVFGFRCYKKRNFASISSVDVLAEKIEKNLSRKIALPKAAKTAEQMKKLDGAKIDYVSLLCHTNPNFKKKPEIFEMRLGGPADKQIEHAKQLLGKQFSISDVFKEGEFVDVSAVTKGKGFEGPVVRHGVKIMRPKAQQMQRHTGSLGQTEPGKVRHTVPQSGQHGFHTRTELNKKILKIAEGKDFTPKGGFVSYGNAVGTSILIEGSVPGHKKRLIRLRVPVRAPKTKLPVERKAISLTSQQGV